MVNNRLDQDGRQSDEIGVPDPGGSFVKNEEEWMNQEQFEDKEYYDAL